MLDPTTPHGKADIAKSSKTEAIPELYKDESEIVAQTTDNHIVPYTQSALGHLQPGDGYEGILDDGEQRRELERKLKLKIDLRLMPCLIIIYILNYLDRNNVGAARLKGFQDDLNLTDTQYNTVLSILYTSYITLQVPSNLFMAKIGKPSIYLPICVGLWGTISALTSLCHTFGQTIAVRIFLGFVEAAFFPGALYLLSKWYTKKELATRTALLYSGSIISNAFSGLIAAGILGNMEGVRNIRAWRWLFIIEGALTVLVAILALFILPDFPHNSRFLSPAEKELAQRRMAEDAGESDVEGESGGLWDGFMLAMKDPKVWILSWMLTAAVVGLAFNQFFPSLTKTLGYGNTQTLLITAGPWAFSFLCVLGNALHADRTGERYWHIVVPLLFGIVGFIISSSTLNLGARFFALFIESSSYAAFVVILTWISNSIPRPTYKRSVALAFVNAFSQLGNIAGSYVWPSHWAPRYWQSNVISLACFVVTIALATVMKFYLTHLNKELDRQRGITEPANPHPDPNAAHAAQGDQHKHHAEEGMDALDRAAQLRGLSTEMAWQARSNFRYLV